MTIEPTRFKCRLCFNRVTLSFQSEIPDICSACYRKAKQKGLIQGKYIPERVDVKCKMCLKPYSVTTAYFLSAKWEKGGTCQICGRKKSNIPQGRRSTYLANPREYPIVGECILQPDREGVRCANYLKCRYYENHCLDAAAKRAWDGWHAINQSSGIISRNR
jgi:hypothetical protein